MTDSERYLGRLCERTFLSLWSYPGVFNDKDIERQKEGKEVADLLVVFERHVIIFSDKNCAYPDTGDPLVDWNRWFKKAILKSAEQVWGAERWIRQHPDRLYLDRVCTRRFPYDLPAPDEMMVHRVVVAHGVAERCRRALGGSGTLMLVPAVRDEAHFLDAQTGRKPSRSDCAAAARGEPRGEVPFPDMPFVVGDLDPERGFVHVLDDASLDVLLGTLDTVSDFVDYLVRKERFVRSGRLGVAAGEDDLLGFYLSDVNAEGEHDFVVPAAVEAVAVPPGHWRRYARGPERAAQRAADAISYLWDRLIETFAKHIVGGGLYHATDPSVAANERIVRVMARESRFRRRSLGGAFVELLERTPTDRQSVRVAYPMNPGDPYYIFLLFPEYPQLDRDEYRRVRRELLLRYCMVLRLKNPAAGLVVGIAMEPGLDVERKSQDAVLYDAADWPEEHRVEAQRFADLGLLREVTRTEQEVHEYPVGAAAYPAPARGGRKARAAPTPPTAGDTAASPSDSDRTGGGRTVVSIRGADRNKPCPCGSGIKAKRCCGR